jgi:hypothetical protein
MNAKDCRAVRREIDTSELGQRLSEPLEMHLRVCAACAQFRTERAQLRELVGSLKPVAAPADFDMRLRARMARERDNRARQPFIFRFAMTTPAIALAALLVVLVGAIVWVNQSQKQRPQVASVNQNKQPADNLGASSANLKNGNAETNQAAVATTDPMVATTDPTKEQKRTNPSLRNPLKSSTMANAPVQASDFSARRAESISLRGDRDGEVSLNAPSKPMVVSVQDANGARHKILLPPISFGSQRLDNRTPVSVANRRDW